MFGGFQRNDLRRLRNNVNNGYGSWFDEDDDQVYGSIIRNPNIVSPRPLGLNVRVKRELTRQDTLKKNLFVYDSKYSIQNKYATQQNPKVMNMHEKKQAQKKFAKNKQDVRPKKQINRDYKYKGDVEVANDLLPDGDLKNLKRLCANLIQSAQNILIKFSKTKPTILFQYSDKQERKSIHLRDIIRGNKQKKIPVQPTLIFRTLDRLYEQVPEQFWVVGKFGLIMAQQKKLYKFKNINISKDAQKLKLYYAKGPQSGFLNFSLFLQELFYVEYNGKYIEENKKGNPKEYEIYEKFQKSIFENDNPDDKLEAADQIDSAGEAQQDQQDKFDEKDMKNNIESEIKMLKTRIQEILDKDLSSYESLMEKKNDRCEELSKIGSTQKLEQLERLAEEVSQMDTYLQNFKNIKNSVGLSILRSLPNEEKEKAKLQMSLKRLILAEKQMDSRLPILGKKIEIFRMLDKSNLFILEGQTGSGKSTQLPQLLCEYYKVFQNQHTKPVLITQPRKLATRSLAQRVAAQMEEEVHGFVEYQASCNNRMLNPKAKIIFKLDRLVLDQMTIDPLLTNYSCLVIDEAHERTISIDVILARVKNILERRKDFKIIVTSASLDTGLFKDYFKKQILKVQGRMFPVTQIFRPLEFVKDIKAKIERILLGQILEPDMTRVKQEYKGHILAFCSGVDQITALVNSFQNKLSNKDFKVLALHGRLSAEEQREVFQESKRTKIIFATRIAETSITINGVKVVIDPGMDREMVYDQKSKISSMQPKNISESSAKQRAGRAGRTNSGYCFRLYSEEEKKKMKSNKTPEIQNMALDTVVLRLKSLKIDDVINFDYLSPPDPEGLKISLETMKIIGCLDSYGNITQIGKLLVKIPIQPFLSRAIIQSIFFKFILSDQENDKYYQISHQQLQKIFVQDLTQSTIRILAMLINSSNLFYVKQCEREDAQKNKFQGYPQMNGDFDLFLKIYSEYLEFYKDRRNEQMKVWANTNYISIKTLHQVREVHKQIHTIVKNSVFDKKQFKDQMKNALKVLKNVKNAQEALMACLVPSFVTNLCLYSQNPQIGYTLICQEIPLHLYGTSILSLQGNSPKWILCYDLYTNQNNQTFCKAAQKIDFQFLKMTVKEEIKKYFKLEQAQKQNPFYKCIKLQLPSLIFMDILADYRKRNTYLQLQFLNKFTFIFNEDQNSIDIYYLLKKFKDMKLNQLEEQKRQKVSMLRESKNDYRHSEKPEFIISSYIKEIKSKYDDILTHEYIGQINIKLDNGFNVKQIDFTKSLYTFKVQVTGEIAELVHYLCSPLGKLTRYDEKMIFQIEGEKNREEFKRKIQILREYAKINLKFSYNKKDLEIKYYEEVVDKRHKIPKAKLFLTFYAGQSKSQNIFLNYKKYEDRESQLQYVSYIYSLLQEAKNIYRELRLLMPKFRPSKNASGINVSFLSANTDQFEMRNILQKIFDQKIVGYGFSMPQSIIKFRQPENPYCFMTDRQWETKIRQLFRKIGGQNQKLTIRVWGTYKRGNNEQEKHSSNVRVNMHAQIESFSLPVMQKFKKSYDGGRVLGTQKVHMTYQFNQTIAAPTYDIFCALREDYFNTVDFQLIKNPKIMIQASDPKLFRNVYKIFITIRGQNRNDFFEPTRKISQLFKPIQMRIQQKHIYRLDWNSRKIKDNILSVLQEKHNYKIHFIFQKKTSILKIFCNQQIAKTIEKQILLKLQEIQIKSQPISYRGKSLKAVLNLIQENQQKLESGKTLQYDISYGRREVILTADIDTLMEVKNKISLLSNQAKQQCPICCGLQQQPYKLLNCEHSFCMLCLVESVKEINDQISCPQGCGKSISIYDIRRILSEDQFNKVCDRQVSKYVEKNPRFHGCFTADCENIFLASQSELQGSFQCELCGKNYCIKCKKSHKDDSCDGSMNLSKLGIKQCPECKVGIQKNGGCNHMSCKCGAHICWKCLKCFKKQKDCYDHLAQECGGVFDRGYIETDPRFMF